MSKKNNTVVLVIPAYNPPPVILPLVKELLNHGMPTVIVDDGSEDKETFAKLKNLSPQLHILQHSENQGKGAALKTAFHYVLKQFPQCDGVVTADADGQHLEKDILAVTRQLILDPKHVVLGTRTFDQDTPLRSRLGNALSGFLFKFLYRQPISDTQTGLRGIPRGFLEEFTHFQSNHYEFEMEMLSFLSRRKHAIKQVAISTVYLDKNKSSHFNPILDSLRVYFVFLRYLIIALLSFAIDISIFALLHITGLGILSSLIIARVISGLFNFYNNKVVVYKALGNQSLRREALGFTLLAIAVIMVSYGFISILHEHFGIGVITSKVLVDATLFICNFIIQKCFIFYRPSDHGAEP